MTAGTVGRGVFVLNRFLSRSPTTIAASPRTVRYGRTTVVEGTVTDGEAGIRVQILKHACYEGARVAATTTTGPGGRWRARIRPVSATTYEATVVQEKSVPLTVRVRPRITLSKLGRGLLRARVLARWSMGGETLVLQQFSRKRWVNRRRIGLRRIARRGAHVVSGRTFRATSTNGRRLRLIYPSRAYACYASAVSPSIRG